MISTVELIDNGVVHRGLVSEQERNALVAKAMELADKLAPGFDSPSGMIWPRINFTTKNVTGNGKAWRGTANSAAAATATAFTTGY